MKSRGVRSDLNMKLHLFKKSFIYKYMALHHYYWITTGIKIIPDIPHLSPELTQTFPVYAQTSPDMVTHECPGYSPTPTEVYPVYADYPLKYPGKPMSALRKPWHSLMVIPDCPNFPLTLPDGPLYPLTSPEVWRCLSGHRNICFIIRKERKCYKKCELSTKVYQTYQRVDKP